MRSLRQRLHDTVFHHDEPAERAFYVVVIVAILPSVLVVMLDGAESISTQYGGAPHAAEWFFTIRHLPQALRHGAAGVGNSPSSEFTTGYAARGIPFASTRHLVRVVGRGKP